jgi:dTMP kinase
VIAERSPGPDGQSAASVASPAPGVPAARPGAHGEPGVLFVLEGIDRSGRSTHVRRLEEHLRYTGRGVTRTSLASSLLSGDLIRGAKRDRHADPTETALLYAADVAERIEQVVLPSLRAGLVVIADRWCWTPMARAEARGVDAAWLDRLFGFVPPPDAILFLDVDPEASLARRAGDPDPYEAGLDLGLSADVRESYRLFQARLYACFDRYAGPAGFTRIPAASEVEPVGQRVLRAADAVLATRAASDPARRSGAPRS